MRNWILAACALAAVSVGAWLVARYDLAQTMYEFETKVQAIGPGRGGIAPAEETVEAQVIDIADELGVEVGDLFVSVEPLTSANIERAGTMTQMVQQRLDDTMADARPPSSGIVSESSSMTADLQDDRAMQVTGTLIEIELHVRAEKWMWSEEEDYATTITLR